MRLRSAAVAAVVWGMFIGHVFAAGPGSITVAVDKPGAKVGPLFYGLMTEEINHAYDGGLYAELIQNRTFQDNQQKPVHWSVVTGGSGGKGEIALDGDKPVNGGALKTSLRLDVTAAASGDGGRVGVANDGFWGIPVWPNTKYRASFYARASEGFAGPLRVTIESNDGATTFAAGEVPSVSAGWKKYEVGLSTSQVPTSTGNRFVIATAGGKGSVWLSLVSLFPPTYNDRPNGNRIDLMQKMADLHPSFLRFPGGNYLEGDTVATRFDWKKTLGPLEDRPGHMGCWNYRSSDGLGLLEFLNWCEDLKMEPLLAVYAGYSLKGEHVQPGPELEPFVREALEEIEYVTGDATATEWGARRAKDGHPEPFKLRYVEIGNEDWFDKSGSYDGRFAQIFDAIKAKYPNLQCIATTKVTSRKPDLYDDHGYPSARSMLKMVRRYDQRDPSLPKVFFGEWATQDGKPTPTVRAALADAAWLTGLQTDCDTVLMNCYAPLLVNVNRGAWQWPTNLIGYDAAASFGSPSYYAQAMFAKAWGDAVLPAEAVAQQVELPPSLPPPSGMIGVGTWRTSAEYKDVTVTGADGQTLFQSDFSSGTKGWKAYGGKWGAADGVLSQTDERRDTWITAGDPKWQDYTLRLKARKVSGNEGFLVLVHVRDRSNYVWFNVGGWGNTKSSIEQASDGAKADIAAAVPFKVDAGKWYDLRVEVKGHDVQCFVDDRPVVQGTEQDQKPTQTLFAAASRVDATGEVILKVVNPGATAQLVEVTLKGITEVAKDAAAEVMTGQPDEMNSIEEPTKVAPKEAPIADAGPTFSHEFPPYSVSVIRLKAK